MDYTTQEALLAMHGAFGGHDMKVVNLVSFPLALPPIGAASRWGTSFRVGQDEVPASEGGEENDRPWTLVLVVLSRCTADATVTSTGAGMMDDCPL